MYIPRVNRVCIFQIPTCVNDDYLGSHLDCITLTRYKGSDQLFVQGGGVHSTFEHWFGTLTQIGYIEGKWTKKELINLIIKIIKETPKCFKDSDISFVNFLAKKIVIFSTSLAVKGELFSDVLAKS